MIHAGAFGWNHSDMNVAKLTNFNVEFANLTALSPNLFDTSELETAKLGGNQWNCICDMMWILDSDADLDQGSKIPVYSYVQIFHTIFFFNKQMTVHLSDVSTTIKGDRNAQKI